MDLKNPNLPRGRKIGSWYFRIEIRLEIKSYVAGSYSFESSDILISNSRILNSEKMRYYTRCKMIDESYYVIDLLLALLRGNFYIRASRASRVPAVKGFSLSLKKPRFCRSIFVCRVLSYPSGELSWPHWSHPFNLLREPLICTPRPLTSVPLLRTERRTRRPCTKERRWERRVIASLRGSPETALKRCFLHTTTLLRNKMRLGTYAVQHRRRLLSLTYTAFFSFLISSIAIA